MDDCHKIKRTPMGDKRFYVYQYSYPVGFISNEGVDLSDIVFYLGKGTVAKPGVAERIDLHEHTANAGTWHWDGKWDQTWKVICGIWNGGMEPNKQVVFQTDDESEAFSEERKLILLYRSPYLTNKLLNKPNSSKANVSKIIRNKLPSAPPDIKVTKLDISTPKEFVARVPAHVKLANQLREDFLAGELVDDGVLFAMQRIAAIKNVSRTTVINAILLLIGEKFVVLHGRQYEVNPNLLKSDV